MSAPTGVGTIAILGAGRIGGGLARAWAKHGHTLVIDRPVIGFSGDESVNGEWTLRVADRATGKVGTLLGWQLTVTSRWD